MNEQLIYDYIKAKDLALDDNYTIENITTAGDMVIFIERDESGYYSQQHLISMFDILTWVYIEMLKLQETL